MNGVLVVKPNIVMNAKELVSCQKSIVKMLEDGVIVLQPSYEISYIDFDNNNDTSEIGFA